MSSKVTRWLVMGLGVAVVTQLTGCAAVVAPLVLGATIGVAKESTAFAEETARTGTRVIMRSTTNAGQAAWNELEASADRQRERRDALAEETDAAAAEAERAVMAAVEEANAPQANAPLEAGEAAEEAFWVP
jgi:hydrogenase maturation factor